MKVSNSSRIERIGVQCVALKFERLGYKFREQPISDYGVDAQIEIVEEDTATGQLVAVQIKSGTSWLNEFDGHGYVFRGHLKHLKYWLKHSLPVIIVLHDDENDDSFWQAVTPTNVIYTKSAWKMVVPVSHKINAGMHVDLKRLVKKIPIHNEYTIASIEDNSHGAAKRYSLKIVLNKEHTQAELVEVIKNCTQEAINCDYHRSKLTRDTWSGTPAHVVWLMVYPTSEDEKNNNFICRTEWFSESLTEDFKPMSNGGENIGNDIKVLWRDDYLSNSVFFDEHTMSKEKYILESTKIRELIEPLVYLIEQELLRYIDGYITFDCFAEFLAESYSKINQHYGKGIDMDIAPYECKELKNKFQSMIAFADNIALPVFTALSKRQPMNELAEITNCSEQIKYFSEALLGYQFELNKVQ